MRPTLGLTSRAGIIPLSLTADDAGGIAGNVRDEAIVLDVIRGRDDADAATASVVQPVKPFASSLDAHGLEGRTIAVVDNFDGGNADVDGIKASGAKTLESAGASVVHITLPKVFENLWNVVLGPVGLAEFRPQFDTYLTSLPDGQPHDMKAFMQALNAHPDRKRHEADQSSSLQGPRREF